MDSCFLVTVPSGAWVTVFSFDLTVPSLLTLLLWVLETWRSHPTSRNGNAKTDVATQITAIRFFILFLHSQFCTRASGVTVVSLIGEAVSGPFLLVVTLTVLSVGFCFIEGNIRHGLALCYGV